MKLHAALFRGSAKPVCEARHERRPPRGRRHINPGRGTVCDPVPILLFCLLILAGCRDAGREAASPEDSGTHTPVRLTSEVDPVKARVADPITFRITLEADPDISVSLPEVGSRIEGFRIVDMGREGPKRREGRIWSQRWYELRADLTGSYILPSLRLPYTGMDGKEHIAETEPLYVEIESVLGHATDEQDIRDLKPLEKARRDIPRSWYLMLVAGLATVGLLVGLVRVARRRRCVKELERTPEEIAREELESLEATGLLEEEQYREYVFGLSLIFRRYLERRFHVPAAEQTTEEIFASLRAAGHLGRTLKETARSFLEETDPIKYRGLEPRPAETEAWRSRLLSFMEDAARGQDFQEAA